MKQTTVPKDQLPKETNQSIQEAQKGTQIGGQSQQYVSQIELLSSNYVEEDYQPAIQRKMYQLIDIKMNFRFFLIMALYFFIFIILYPIFLVMLVLTIFVQVKEIILATQTEDRMEKLKRLMLFSWFLIIVCATLDTQVVLITYLTGDTILKYLFLDALTFFLSSLLVISFICAAGIKPQEDLRGILYWLTHNQTLVNTLFYQDIRVWSQNIKQFDLQRCDGSVKSQQNYYLQGFDAQNCFCYFTYFKLDQVVEQKDYIKGKFLRLKLKEQLHPNFTQYFILVFIIVLKTILSFWYIFQKDQAISSSDIFHTCVTLLFYLYTSWILHRVLGNYDLKRKTVCMNDLLDKINFFDLSTEGLGEKLDITCSTSLETWDNIRRFICEIDFQYLKDLEFAYFCLFFYYVFVVLIILSAYGEFYWIFTKESIFLQPLMIILNTMNFVFLNAFLLFRIYEGQKYNDTFSDLEEQITHLLDLTNDLQTMYNQFFQINKFIEGRKKTHKYFEGAQYVTDILVDNFQKKSAYGLLIKKIKQLSKHYINNNIEYLENKYNLDEKQKLRKKMLKNMAQSLLKVQQSIKRDAQSKQYKFLNHFNLQFGETLGTVIIGTFSVLPNVIPKLIEFYKQEP